MARTILLSGACGSGKTAVADLGHKRLRAALGPTAVIGTDRLFMMLDPLWELPYEPDRLELVYRQVALLVASFFGFGVPTVMVVGNALHTPSELDLLLVDLLEAGEVFHVTLDPSLAEIIRRVRLRGDDKTEEWLASHVEWMRAKYGSWTARIDNSALSPGQTLDALAEVIDQGGGRLVETFGSADQSPGENN
ncbi:MAG TPA: hypothetical protein VE990_17670 [Acidimicrobiales bacterium]|nr:hypothetical protein [Acidimicrobiales bacterium]